MYKPPHARSSLGVYKVCDLIAGPYSGNSVKGNTACINLVTPVTLCYLCAVHHFHDFI